MRYIKHITAIVLTTFATLTLSAQANQTQRIGGFEFGAGMNILGPIFKMSNLMVEYGFDEYELNWVHLDEKNYPRTIPAGVSLQASYFRQIKTNTKFGLKVDFTRFSKVYGLSTVSGHLDVLFSSIYLTPVYGWETDGNLEIYGGPSLMINRGRKTSIYDEIEEETEERYTKLSPGLLAGVCLKLWDGTDTYGKVGLHGVLALPAKMGPFSAKYGFNSYDTIPENKVGFSHIQLVFIFGIHHWRFQGM